MLFNKAFHRAAVLAVTLGAMRSGHAHVAPSVDDNNRYLKVTPMKGGFRLAYTVFFGEVPGAAERRRVDENQDGRIDPGEAKRFGDKLAAQVAASLTLELPRGPGSGVDTIPVRWSVTDTGLGSTTAVTGGAFSVDMIGYLCAPGERLRLRDAFRVLRPGETEVVVDDSPGVTVTVARIGSANDPRRDWRFLGAGGPLTDDGLEVAWTSSSTTSPLPVPCRSPPGDGGVADGRAVGRGGRGGRRPGGRGLPRHRGSPAAADRSMMVQSRES